LSFLKNFFGNTEKFDKAIYQIKRWASL